MPTVQPFRLHVRGQWIDMTVEHAASFGLNHIGSALGLPRLDWTPGDHQVTGTPAGLGDAVACAAWAQALAGNPTRIVAVSGRHTIEVTGG
ncbi:hypothetical protein BH11ACT5_BH11ACT5_13200 [soil metagenome]